jgi:hypothetical protein
LGVFAIELCVGRESGEGIISWMKTRSWGIDAFWKLLTSSPKCFMKICEAYWDLNTIARVLFYSTFSWIDEYEDSCLEKLYSNSAI